MESTLALLNLPDLLMMNWVESLRAIETVLGIFSVFDSDNSRELFKMKKAEDSGVNVRNRGML